MDGDGDALLECQGGISEQPYSGMLVPVEAVRESLHKVGIDSEVKLAVELVVLLDAALEWPVFEVGTLRLTVRSDWNVGVGVLEIDKSVGGTRRGRCQLGRGRSRLKGGC